MIFQRKWSFGIGSVFSLIAVYFIYLYSKDRGWASLAFLSKWYLIIAGTLMTFSLLIILIVFLVSLLVLLAAIIKLKLGKKHKKKSNSYIDAEFRIKE